MNLKKGQYVAFMTNQPAAHLNEMFGYNDLGPDNFEKMEEVGRIKTLIDESTFLINTGGFYCVVDTKDILRVVPIEDALSRRVRTRRTDLLSGTQCAFLSGSALWEYCPGKVRECCARGDEPTFSRR